MKATATLKRIGQDLASLREKKGLTQTVLATKLGLSSGQFVSNWERGLCFVPTALARPFAALLGVKVATVKALYLEREAALFDSNASALKKAS